MPDPTGKAQALAIDNFAFTATTGSGGTTNTPANPWAFRVTPQNPFVITWPGLRRQLSTLHHNKPGAARHLDAGIRPGLRPTALSPASSATHQRGAILQTFRPAVSTRIATEFAN